jgi:hypothetical protein
MARSSNKGNTEEKMVAINGELTVNHESPRLPFNDPA